MFDDDLLIAFILMAVLFLRQIVILKQPNKINYAPLMLGIGSVSSIIHFMIHPDNHDILLIARESLFPLLVSLILYVIMNILHQTQQSLHSKTQDDFIKVLVQEINQLKNFILELEKRMINSQADNIRTQEEIRKNFKDDIKILDLIQENQIDFLEKFSELELWHEDVNKSFKHFSETQLPELDNVVHKHIDILRISEQDHYNKLQDLLKKAVESRFDISEDVNELKDRIKSMQHITDDISTSIIQKTLEKISAVTKAFENDILLLKSNAATISISLSESETTMGNIKTQSEMIMKQMILSSKKMNELEKKNSGLNDIFYQTTTLLHDIDVIKSDYVKAQLQLTILVDEIKNINNKQHDDIQIKLEKLAQELADKIDMSLEDLHKHYHIVGEDVSKNVNLLAKKAQIQKGYSN